MTGQKSGQKHQNILTNIFTKTFIISREKPQKMNLLIEYKQDTMSSNQFKEARRSLINEIDSLGLRRRPDSKKEYTWEELHTKYGTKSRSELKKKQIERAAELVKQLKEARAELAKAREEKASA